MMMGRPVPQAGLYGLLSIVLIAGIKGAVELCIAHNGKPPFAAIWDAIKYGVWNTVYALEMGARRSLPILAAVGAVGIIMGALYQTGLGVKFASLVTQYSFGNLFLGICLVGLASFVLGMGLPTSASYIVLSVMAVPALLELGQGHEIVITILSAHLIVFWFSLDSSFTPPVCVPAYTAAGIADAKPNKGAWAAFRTAKGMYVVPMLFAFSPVLLLDQPLAVAEVVLFGIVGFMGLAAVMVGFLYVKIGVAERILLAAVTLCLFWPEWYTHVIGLALFSIFFFSQRHRYIKEHGHAPSAR